VKKWLAWIAAFLLLLFTVVVGIGADVITKGLIGKEDIYWGTDGAAPQTFSRATSTGATITLTRVNGSQIPWDNSYTRTIRPLSVVGNGTGSISGFLNITAAGALSGATLSTTGNGTIGGTLGVEGALTALSVSAGSGTITALGSDQATANALATFLVEWKHGTMRRTFGTAAPTSGTYTVGSIVFNTAPAAATTISANPVYWICTSAGTPGTWRAVYPLFLVAPASATALGKPGMMAYDNTYLYINAPANDNAWKRVQLASW
jgi:hypothetical protein